MKKLSAAPILFFVFLTFSCVTGADSPVTNAEGSGTSSAAEPAAVQPSAADTAVIPGDAGYFAQDQAAAADSVKPAEPVVAAPLSDDAFRAEILNLMPWNMSVVENSHTPVIIMHDLDKNGFRDALAVAVESGDGTETRLEKLSESTRLFQADPQYVNFFLLIFYQYEDEVVLRYTVPVSRQLVFNGVKPVEIKLGSDFPYALMFTFRTRSGIEKEMIILSGYGITRFTITDSLSEITIFDDIDEDGFRDIVVHEQGFEEGTGFETFLTWYKWNLKEYTEYKSTNIVRNLRQFFLVCTEYLRSGEFDDFLNYALDPELLAEFDAKGLNKSEILAKIFIPVDVSQDEEIFFNGDGLSTVVFPDIMETPFSYANRSDFSSQISVRMGRPGEKSRIFLAELKMKKNPFQNRQFCFDINDY